MTKPAPQAAERSSARMSALLDELDLQPMERELLRRRWLEQVAWTSDRARTARRWFYVLRLPVVVGGVAVPGLVSVALSTSNVPGLEYLRWLTFGVSLLVAIFAALEEVFHFGERWRHYRRTSEVLKAVGWHFLMLNGPFAKYPTHAAAYRAFGSRIEDILSEDVEGYLGQIASDSGEREHHEVYH